MYTLYISYTVYNDKIIDQIMANMNLFSKHLCSRVYKRIKSKTFLYDKPVVRRIRNKGEKQDSLNFKSKYAGVHSCLSINLFRKAVRWKIQLNKDVRRFFAMKRYENYQHLCRLQPRLLVTVLTSAVKSVEFQYSNIK